MDRCSERSVLRNSGSENTRSMTDNRFEHLAVACEAVNGSVIQHAIQIGQVNQMVRSLVKEVDRMKRDVSNFKGNVNRKQATVEAEISNIKARLVVVEQGGTRGMASSSGLQMSQPQVVNGSQNFGPGNQGGSFSQGSNQASPSSNGGIKSGIVERTVAGRFQCPMCKKDFAPSYILKHVDRKICLTSRRRFNPLTGRK